MVVVRSFGNRGIRELVFNGYRFSVGEDKKVLDKDSSGDGCTPVLMYLMPDNYPFKSGYNGKFYLMYVFTKKRKEREKRTEQNPHWLQSYFVSGYQLHDPEQVM